jgi:hypothetical protein
MRFRNNSESFAPALEGSDFMKWWINAKGLQIKDIGSTKAKIAWDSQSGVGYFCVNWSRDNVTPNGCDVKVKGSDSSYKPTDLKANKTYYVWVQACNNSGVCSSAAKTDFKTKK